MVYIPTVAVRKAKEKNNVAMNLWNGIFQETRV